MLVLEVGEDILFDWLTTFLTLFHLIPKHMKSVVLEHDLSCLEYLLAYDALVDRVCVARVKLVVMHKVVNIVLVGISAALVKDRRKHTLELLL
jgi:hypothetical protein